MSSGCIVSIMLYVSTTYIYLSIYLYIYIYIEGVLLLLSYLPCLAGLVHGVVTFVHDFIIAERNKF